MATAVSIWLDESPGVVRRPGDAVNGTVWFAVEESEGGPGARVQAIVLAVKCIEETKITRRTGDGKSQSIRTENGRAVIAGSTLLLYGKAVSHPDESPPEVDPGTCVKIPFSIIVPAGVASTYVCSTGDGLATVSTIIEVAVLSPDTGSTSRQAIELPVETLVHLEEAVQYDHNTSLDHRDHFIACCGSSFDTDLHIDRATFCYGEMMSGTVTHGLAGDTSKQTSAVNRTKLKVRLKCVTEFKAGSFKCRREYYSAWHPMKQAVENMKSVWNFSMQLALNRVNHSDRIPLHSFLGENVLVKYFLEINYKKSSMTKWNKNHHIYMCNAMCDSGWRNDSGHQETKNVPSPVPSGVAIPNYPDYKPGAQGPPLASEKMLVTDAPERLHFGAKPTPVRRSLLRYAMTSSVYRVPDGVHDGRGLSREGLGAGTIKWKTGTTRTHCHSTRLRVTHV